MFARASGRRRAHIRRAAHTADEAWVLIGAVEDLAQRLETIADPEVERLRRRAQASLDRAKAALIEGAARLQGTAEDLAETDAGLARPWALLAVAAVCAVVVGVWSGRAMMAD
jgi:ElaB/YqjD/DUF883 family membrane-anchored ribosome-binding protein